VVVGLVSNEDGAFGRGAHLTVPAGAGLEVVDDRVVGIEDVQPGVVGHREDEAPVRAHRHDGLHPEGVEGEFVVLAEAGAHVDQPGAVLGRDEARRRDLVRAGIPQVVGERRRVAAPDQL